MNRAQIVFRILAALLAAASVVYVGDYMVLRLRVLRSKPNWPVESITRTRVLAIPQKNGKFDYEIDPLQPIETLSCVHALLPHLGWQPCWYLKPRVNQPIVMN